MLQENWKKNNKLRGWELQRWVWGRRKDDYLSNWDSEGQDGLTSPEVSSGMDFCLGR